MITGFYDASTVTYISEIHSFRHNLLECCDSSQREFQRGRCLFIKSRGCYQLVLSFGYVHNYIQDVLFNDISLQRVRMRHNDTCEVAQRYATFIIPYHEVY